MNEEGIDLSYLNLHDLKKGTSLWYMKTLNTKIVPYIIHSIQEYRKLFLFDKEHKQEFKKLKDSDVKEFKKFV